MVLEKIKGYNDVRRIPAKELPLLADEIRDFLIDAVSRNGGHLASNLGAVELTIALHRCLDFPDDKIVWDVGHQSYTHKILTGRKDAFVNLRKKDGLSGFPKREESCCDAFDTGHSSTSISAGLGLVYARERRGEHHTVVSVIGDGSMTGGMAYEALNNAAALTSNFIIILNDNEMSISRNVGGMSRYLAGIRTLRGYNELKENISLSLKKIPGIGQGLAEGISRTKKTLKQMVVPGMLFENMGITCLGPVDGHDIDAMVQVIQDARNLDRAVMILVKTQKGRGYEPAERRPDKFHGVGPFDRETGQPLGDPGTITYTDAFSKILCRLAREREDIVGITAAMSFGTGMHRFAKLFPDRFYDVGIAEEHAVTFAAGLAAGGLHPVVAIYSSFLQRAYDQILHDVCMQNLPVIFAIDRAGLVGADGETHQGMFDLAYLRSMPNMTVIAPKDLWEFQEAFRYAAAWKGPVAIRYPKTEACRSVPELRQPYETGRCEILENGKDIVLFAAGAMTETAVRVSANLQKNGLQPTVVNLRFVKPLDREAVIRLSARHRLCVTMEENVLAGGIGEEIGALLLEEGIATAFLKAGAGDCFVRQGSIAEQRRILGLDEERITARILEKWNEPPAGGCDADSSVAPA